MPSAPGADGGPGQSTGRQSPESRVSQHVASKCNAVHAFAGSLTPFIGVPCSLGEPHCVSHLEADTGPSSQSSKLALPQVPLTCDTSVDHLGVESPPSAPSATSDSVSVVQTGPARVKTRHTTPKGKHVAMRPPIYVPYPSLPHPLVASLKSGFVMAPT